MIQLLLLLIIWTISAAHADVVTVSANKQPGAPSESGAGLLVPAHCQANGEQNEY
jgi:hypothetical protein